MRIGSFLLAPGMAVFLLAGCAGDATPPDHDSAGALSMPDKSDSPPVTMSGYVDTSVTARIK